MANGPATCFGDGGGHPVGGPAVVAHADTADVTGQWQKYTVTLQTGHDVSTPAKAKSVLSAAGPGTVPFSLASLFEPLTDAAATFKRTFPPHSLTLLRVAVTGK